MLTMMLLIADADADADDVDDDNDVDYDNDDDDDDDDHDDDHDDDDDDDLGKYCLVGQTPREGKFSYWLWGNLLHDSDENYFFKHSLMAFFQFNECIYPM